MSGVRKLNGKLDKKASRRLMISKQGTDTVWRNAASQVLNNVIAYVPYKILGAMKQLERMVSHSGLEYGLYLKGKYADGILEVSEEFMIPEQIVTAGTIDFIEDDHGEFNGVIHRHPMNLKVFSGTDRESINQNYEFSLLYTQGDIVTGIVNLELADGFGRVQLTCEVHVEYPEVELDQDEVDRKIVQRPIPVLTASRGGYVTPGGLYKPTPTIPTPVGGGLKRFENNLSVKDIDDDIMGSEEAIDRMLAGDSDVDLDTAAWNAYLNDRDDTDVDANAGHMYDMQHFLVD